MIRNVNPDATHNCWAYVAGPPGDSASIGSSDDGEPHGTAGRPMLNALLHCGIGQICVVVSRWFGGIKLGAGGLVHAYQAAVLENIASLPVVELTPRSFWQIKTGYASVDAIRRSIFALDGGIENEEYAEGITLDISIPMEKSDELKAVVANLTNGSAIVAALVNVDETSNAPRRD